MKKSIPAICIFLLLLFMATSVVAVPNLISYQGVLNDGGGTPMSGAVNMTFSIYLVDTAGTALWNETQSVTVSNGLFNVKLGSVQQLPASVFNSDSLFLGIKVGADPEMLPRQRITAGPYVPAVLPIGSIMAWAKDLTGVPALADGWVECNGQTLDDNTSPLDGQIIPNLNGENKFLRGNDSSGGNGGMSSHEHNSAFSFLSSGSGYLVLGGYGYDNAAASGEKLQMNLSEIPFSFYNSSISRNYKTSTASSEPPYHNVVWIMKIK